MKFLHIIQLNERNSYQLFKQLYKTYDLSEHTFLVINSRSALKNFPLFSEFNAFIYLPDGRVAKMKLIYQKMSQAQYIIFNSLLFNSNKYLIFLYLCCRHFLRKAAWIEWGGDLYNWVRNRRGIKNYFINHVNYYIRKHMQIIGVTFEADSEEVHRQFGENIPCFFTPLPFGEDRINLLQKTKPLKKGSRPVRVQIAHNSLQVNNHIAILSMLEDFCDQDIQIILPLNYGSFGIGGQYGGEAYRKSVISCAKQFFSKKAIIIFKKMDLECYLRYLWNIDIAVFDCKRPIGLANIYYLLYMRKKIFLPSDSVHYKYLKAMGVAVYCTEDIPNMSYEEFIDMNDIKTSTFVLNKFKPLEEIKFWGTFFNQVETIIGGKA